MNSSSLTLLVLMSNNWISPSYYTVLWRFQYSSFLTKFIHLVMCLVCLVSLPFLSIHTAELLSNIMISAYYLTTSVSFFIISLFIILNFDRAIPAVHSILYSLSALDWSTGCGTCRTWLYLAKLLLLISFFLENKVFIPSFSFFKFMSTRYYFILSLLLIWITSTKWFIPLRDFYITVFHRSMLEHVLYNIYNYVIINHDSSVGAQILEIRDSSI